MQGITGKLSGKMGSAVFRVRSGQQVVAQYNPIVKNPNTAGQQSSRAAFKLMSQLAAVMEKGMGSFIIKTKAEKGKPSKRNAFFEKNYGLITTADTAQGVVASIPMEQLQLTNSFREFGSLEASPGTDNIVVEMTAADGNTKGGKIVLVGYGSMSVTKSPRIIKTFDFDFTDGQATIEFNDLEPGEYTVLSYGYIASDELLAKTSLDNLHTPVGTPFIGQINLEQALADGSVVCTMTIGSNVTIEGEASS